MSDRPEHVSALSTTRRGNPKWAFWRRNKDPFSGKRYYDFGYWYRRPKREYIEKDFQGFPIADNETEYRHRDIYGRVTIQKKDVLQYISPSESHPRPLLVQATPEARKSQPAGDWRRVKLSGKDYPKHTRNRLDARPGTECNAMNSSIKSGEKAPNLRTKIWLLRPRLLMVLKNGTWELGSDTSRVPYAFISFTAVHFPFRRSTSVSENQASDAQRTVDRLAQEQTLEAGMKAYWVDFRCCAPDDEEDLHTADVHRMCDVIRGAEHVFVLLPDLSRQKKLEWGARMWTLPEALLARRQEIKFCSPSGSMTVSKLGMADHVWDDGDPLEGDHQPTRLLAEHYSSVLTLGRLELFTIALEALSSRRQNGSFSNGDIAYALMGLLHYRIDLDRSDTLAKLSLANDSDRLIERMVCMFPNPDRQDADSESNLFLALTDPTNRTLILDSCRGVSIRWKAFPQMKYKRSYGLRKFVAEIVLRSGATWSALGLGLIIKYAWDYDNQINSSNPEVANNYYGSADWSHDVGLIFLGCVAMIAAFLLSLGAPSAVRRLYGGRVMQSAPWLVGFEGVLPAAELETLIFGNNEARLTYDPSSTPFCERDPDERIGVEPKWIPEPMHHPKPQLPQGHRFFTLVDTGSLTVSVFSARRPPSVALVCGREGGMLRAVLCHYERSDNCLYKETVVRMDSVTLNQAKGLSWVKVGLGDNRMRLGE
ncbi:MAG: hypothetical protein Q9216_000910 [Gyalolechia sp. 2 TL-2023]